MNQRDNTFFFPSCSCSLFVFIQGLSIHVCIYVNGRYKSTINEVKKAKLFANKGSQIKNRVVREIDALIKILDEIKKNSWMKSK